MLALKRLFATVRTHMELQRRTLCESSLAQSAVVSETEIWLAKLMHNPSGTDNKAKTNLRFITRMCAHVLSEATVMIKAVKTREWLLPRMHA